jgi:hypothetical protein
MDLSDFKELILIFFIILVVALNIWLFTASKKNKSSSSLDILRKTADSLQDPFKHENKNMEELSFLVKNLSIDNENQKYQQNEETK